tara:strand:+ start:454 stop:645 length:192 start_codon:yes stop_codon:yes gene_type:complete
MDINIDVNKIVQTGTYDVPDVGLVVWYKFNSFEATEEAFINNMAYWKSIGKKTKVIGTKILIF